jgi:hypothetical protein
MSKHQDWGGVTLDVSGDDELLALLRAAAADFPQESAAAVLHAAQKAFSLAVGDAPIGGAEEGDRHIGELRGSAAVSEPEIDATGVSATVSFNTPYALAQHQRRYKHPHGGERLYLTTAVREEGRIYVEDLARELAPVLARS